MSDMEEELRSHIQHRADDLERSGIDRAEAERRARIEFGGYVRYKEESYEASGGQFFETLLQDLRYAARMLRKSPNFTAVAVSTLALGIGANAVVFGVMNALILRPLDLPQAQKLFMIERDQRSGDQDSSPMQSYPDYRDLRDRNRSFDGLIAYDIDTAGLDTGGSPSPVWLYEASGNYFDVLGVQPYLGRFFHSTDERGPNSAPYIVLGYAYWQSHFKGDRGVVGRSVQLNKHPYTILGVAPPQFRGTELYFRPDFWVPIVNDQQVAGESDLEARDSRGTWLVGRLKAGVTPAQAVSDLNSIAAYLGKTYPKEEGQASFSLVRPGLLGNMLGRPVRAFVTGLMLLAGLILLAACANLGSLFASRAADRSKEIALRLALGSSRKRILRQLLTEAVLVSMVGGTAGVLGGVALLRWLSAWQPLTRHSDQYTGTPGCEGVWSESISRLGEWIALRHRSSAAGDASRSVSNRQIGHHWRGWSAGYGARLPARFADRGLRGAGDFFIGCGAGHGALAAQQFRFRSAQRCGGEH